MKWFVLPILVLPFLAGCAPMIIPVSLPGQQRSWRLEQIEELRPRAAQCDAEAQFTVGFVFLNEGMEEEGAELLTVATQQGHAASQYWLGRWHGGYGAKRGFWPKRWWTWIDWTSLEVDRVRDLVKAYLLVSLAALQEYQCIRRYPLLPLLPGPDIVKPVDSFGRRKTRLDQFIGIVEYFACAAETREELAESMTPEQIAEAEKLIQEWKPQKCVPEGEAAAIAG